jgi:hypothetical protein
MGYIIEPKGVDFIIKSKPLTATQSKALSEFIAKRKLEISLASKQNKVNSHQTM